MCGVFLLPVSGHKETDTSYAGVLAPDDGVPQGPSPVTTTNGQDTE